MPRPWQWTPSPMIPCNPNSLRRGQLKISSMARRISTTAHCNMPSSNFSLDESRSVKDCSGCVPLRALRMLLCSFCGLTPLKLFCSTSSADRRPAVPNHRFTHHAGGEKSYQLSLGQASAVSHPSRRNGSCCAESLS